MKTHLNQDITKKYVITFNEPSYNATYTFKRFINKGAFQYGNQTGASIETMFDNGEKKVQLIDTRYDMTVDDFDVWCDEYLKSAFDKSFEPNWREVQIKDCLSELDEELEQ